MTALDEWVAAQVPLSRAALARAVSATGLSHERAEFGRRVTPLPGSVLASTVSARWDPAPDYFFHWVRDAAVAMLLAPRLVADDPAWAQRMADYVAFSLEIATRPGPAANPLRAGTRDDHLKFLRPDAELAALSGDALLGEPRVETDGAADMERWSRPQHDGPALRALSCLAWDGPAPEGMATLIELDLAYTLRHAAEPCIGPWEEDEPPDLHAFTLLAQRAALRAGREWLPSGAVAAALDRIDRELGALCSDNAGCLRASGRSGEDECDAAAVLGALLEEDDGEPFGCGDPRIAATVEKVTASSIEAFAVSSPEAPLVGRWPGDVYFGGNPWLPTSFGFAEFAYRRALDAGPARAAELVCEGDRVLDGVRSRLSDAGSAPGPLPEQLDRDTARPTSCLDLTWSHAALIAAVDARNAAVGSEGARQRVS